ncbi:MAG: prepilin-type N-terminal cleavage/methylation domain-containing protein [Proteobacteria bacterium]|nr:prepilin-type N-terminal cleavage/methylation domain-containing protein [Pseudomonadota bacterium]
MNRLLGFSLLELLIVMAIITILLTVSYPLYLSHLVKARRNQAAINLVYIASQLENFYSLYDSYQGATLEALGVSAFTDDHSYMMSLQSLGDNTYLIAAIPQGHQAESDLQCQSLLINEKGEKMISGAGNSFNCWS